MNIFHKVALQGLKNNRTRTIVTIIGVILSATMITAVATFGTSLLNFLIKGSIVKYGNWHVAFEDIDIDFIKEQDNRDEVANTTVYENIGYSQFQGVKSKEKPYLFIAGFLDDTFDTLPINLISGRLPENSSEVLVPSHIFLKAGVKFSIGDTLTLNIGNRMTEEKRLTQHDSYHDGEEILVPLMEKTYTVVGICERPSFEEHSAPGYTLITKADLENSSNNYSQFVTLKNPYKVNNYVSTVANKGACYLNEDVLKFMGISENKLFNTVLYSMGGVLIAIIMIGAIFLIYNSFHISLNERTHQFGILMSVGATARQLRNSVLFEGLCIGIIGIPIGVLVGIGSIKLILPIVTNNFSTMINSTVPLTLFVSGPALLVAAFVSLITILISAYIPAKKSANTPVMECIRQTNEIKVEAKDVKTSKLIQRMFGFEGMIAGKNFRRNKKRYRSVVLSLTLSVVLFVTGSAFSTTLKRFAKANTVEVDGDISFYTKDMKESEVFQLYDKLKDVEGVYKSTYQANLTYPCMTNALPSDFVKTYRESVGDKSTKETLELSLDVQFLEDTVYFDFIKSLGFPTEEYSGQDGKVLIVGVNTVEHKTYFTNDTMNFTLYLEDGMQSKTISATFVDTYPLDLLPMDSVPTYYFVVVAPWQMKAQFDVLDVPSKFGVTFWSQNPTKSVKKMESIIMQEGVTSDYTLLNLSSAVDLFRSITFVVDVFTTVFITMLSLIGVANVFNTMSTNIRLRRRELAMLRSVGMSDRDFNKMMCFECVFYGMRTLMFGVPIATLFSWFIYKVLVLQEGLDNFAFIFPLKSIGISVIGVFFVVFITMIYVTSKIRKENIIDALRNDTN